MKVSMTHCLAIAATTVVLALGLAAPAFAQQVYADEGQPVVEPAVSDPFNPNPGVTVGDPGEKSYPGSQWSFIGFKTDQTLLEAIFLSGQTASGTFPQCPVIPNWTVTVKRGAVTLATFVGNAWNIVDGNNRCGLHFTFKHTNFEILGPGTYEFRVSWPAYGSDVVTTRNLNACNTGATLPMYAARNDVYTDNFYTTLYSDWALATGSYGYYNTGIPFRVSKSNPRSSPWKRFFKDAPQIEHFYTYSDSDSNTVLSYGWVYEHNEGNVFAAQELGTVPITRLSQWDGATSNLQHIYLLSASDVAYYQSIGFISDGVVGYVCP